MTTNEHKMTRHTYDWVAKMVAKDDDCFYGFCIFDGAYYTGTQEQLKKISCVAIIKAE